MDRKACLDAAASCVLQDRNDEYGGPEENFTDVAALWTVIFRRLLKPGVSFEPHHVALGQDAVKTARLMGNPTHADSWVDKAGYAACGAEVATRDFSEEG